MKNLNHRSRSAGFQPAVSQASSLQALKTNNEETIAGNHSKPTAPSPLLEEKVQSRGHYHHEKKPCRPGHVRSHFVKLFVAVNVSSENRLHEIILGDTRPQCKAHDHHLTNAKFSIIPLCSLCCLLFKNPFPSPQTATSAFVFIRVHSWLTKKQTNGTRNNRKHQIRFDRN